MLWIDDLDLVKRVDTLQASVVFYIAVVALLVGTNLRTSRWKKRGAKFKEHVVQFEEGEGATDRIVSKPKNCQTEYMDQIMQV